MAIPAPISSVERQERRDRILFLAGAVGFVGRVEYKHAYSNSGGAQYGHGITEGEDTLTVFAEAFDRDATREDFSLMAFVAHERGHQLLARHPRLKAMVRDMSPSAEEVLASLVGALILVPGLDQDSLVEKATFDILRGGGSMDAATRIIRNLWDQLGAML